MKTVHILLVTLAMVSSVWTCSPEGYRNVHMDEMANSTAIIAYGMVTKTFPHEYERKGFTAEFEVKCTYKNGPISSSINISDAGYMSGMCGYKNFTVGVEYIAFLRQDDGKYYQVYDKTMKANTSMMELMTFCGLRLDYPTDGQNNGQCQEVPKGIRGCIQFQPQIGINTSPGMIGSCALSVGLSSFFWLFLGRDLRW